MTNRIFYRNKIYIYEGESLFRVAARWTDLGGEHGLPGLGDHVELLDGGGQVAGGPQVGEAHEAALGPHVVVGPVVPLVGGVGGWTHT